MGLRRDIENWWDGLGPWAKPARKGLEQILHALMAGIPGFLVVFWLPVGWPVKLALACLVALVAGGTREYLQNRGDPPDKDTLFVIGRVPVNFDMILDMAAYVAGGLAAGAIAGLFAL